jgi:TonB family protein
MAALLLLASCAQAPQKVADNTSEAAESAQRQQVIINFMAHEPPTHASAQDITYNSHYPPRFPPEAIRAGHYGTVILMIYVSANGQTGDIRVERSTGYPELDASAIDAAKHWIYLPAAKDGVPQPGWIRTPVTFERPIPPPPSTDSLQVGVATEADARALLGEPVGTMKYTSGLTDLIWGNRSVGTVILRFDITGKLTKIYRSAPAPKS